MGEECAKEISIADDSLARYVVLGINENNVITSKHECNIILCASRLIVTFKHEN
jgi:hypothetical protein